MIYVFFFSILGCSDEEPKSDTSVEETQVVDHRETFPDSNAELIFTPPDFEIPPYADLQTCWYTTYTGNDVAIVGGSFRQSEKFGHHVILSGFI